MVGGLSCRRILVEIEFLLLQDQWTAGRHTSNLSRAGRVVAGPTLTAPDGRGSEASNSFTTPREPDALARVGGIPRWHFGLIEYWCV